MKAQPDKTKASFDYKGNTFSGYIISSTDLHPYFHWFLLDDVNLVEKFGDSIAFTEENGILEPVRVLPKHAEFIRCVQECVEAHLKKKR